MKREHGRHAPHSAEQHAHHGFDDPAAFAQRLESPEREAWQKPDEVIASFQLPRDATVAEIGAGTGYFAVRLARRFDEGTVIALDAEPKMVAHLRRRAADLGLTNLDARLAGQPDSHPLPERVDLLLCVDAYHHIPNRIAYFAAYARNLKRGGRLVVIDRASGAPDGPPAELRLSPGIVERELAQAGYALVGTLDMLLPYQFYLVFTPAVGDAGPA
jgi:cyclopropane fatty-acyl-phospholipid synthase-like methyltransferase